MIVYPVVEIFQGRPGQVIPCATQRLANGTFKNCVRENNDELSEEDLSLAVDEGCYSDGYGYEVFLVGPCDVEGA